MDWLRRRIIRWLGLNFSDLSGQIVSSQIAAGAVIGDHLSLGSVTGSHINQDNRVLLGAVNFDLSSDRSASHQGPSQIYSGSESAGARGVR